jgi:2-dehydro-3-deoxyphosphogluconate aldolase / (4S)-4-hydroxy-2-oxoglutarate aldolase
VRHQRSVEQEALWQAVVAARVIPILRLEDEYPLLDIARALREGGIGAIEFPLTTPGALDAVAACREHCADVVVGVGTVHSASDARRALDAGAQFLASYGFDDVVVRAALEGGALAFPGVLTPTEIAAAWQAGADAAKVYPASVLGPGYIAHLRAPLPHVPLLPSGGITAAEVADYLRAGATAVGVGDLVDPAALDSGDWAAVTSRARTLTEKTLDRHGGAGGPGLT